MGYFKALKQFTRASRAGIIVGDPDHRDPRARYLELDDTFAQGLVTEGLIEKTSRGTFHKHMEEAESDAGQALVDQVAGKRPRVSARQTDQALAEEAAIRGVDISKAKNRGEVIKLINAADTSSAPEEAEGTDNAFSRGSRETAESTLHSRRASPQNAVGDSGTVDVDMPAAPATGEAEVAPGEEAPTGGGGGEAGSGGA